MPDLKDGLGTAIRVEGNQLYIDEDITEVDLTYLGFDTTSTHEVNAGELAWNTDEETIDAGINTNVTLHLGQHAFYHVINQTGSTITKGTVVMSDGTLGASGKIKITPAVADGSVPSKHIMGVTAESIANGDTGMVTAFGKVRGVNTSAFSDGDILYADPSTPGGLTTTVPTAPEVHVTVAIVINAASNGTLFVRPTYGASLDTDDHVNLTSETNGDLLVYDSATGVWVNESPSEIGLAELSGADFTGNITVPNGGTIGSATTPDAITVASDGGVTLNTGAIYSLTLTGSAPVLRLLDTTTSAEHFFTSNNNELRVTGEQRVSIYTGTGDSAEFNEFGDLTLNAGNLVIGTSGNGIDFSATSDAAGSTSELLDDYEEGTWTPVIADASSGGNTATASISDNWYTKIGNLVTVSAKCISIDTTGMTGTNTLYIQGLPFTVNVAGEAVGAILTSHIDYNARESVVIRPESSDYMRIITSDNAGATATTLTVNDITSSSAQIQLSVSYRV